MHRISFRALLLATSVILTPALRSAYDPAIVAADARWVVYLDLNGVRASTLGKELVDAVEAAQKQATDGAIGIDVSKLLAMVGAITAYGTNLAPDPKLIDGALIAQGTADLRKILESVLLQGTLTQPKVFAEATDLPFPAYAISDPDAKAEDKAQVMVAFPPEPVVIVSKSKAQLLKARDVARGAAPSLAKAANSPLGKARAEGAYLYSAMVVPAESPFPKNAPQARILQLTQSGSLAIGERGPNTFAHAELLASSEANAERLMKIMQGLTAMLGLAETNDAHLAEFLQSAEVSRNKSNVTLDLAYSSARLAQMVKSMRTQADVQAAKRKQPTIVMGRPVAEWGATEGAEPVPDSTAGTFRRTIDRVQLVNGSTITLGRTVGRTARFVGLEIVAADGGGTPLTIRPEFMRNVRGTMWQYPFPGTAGTYALKVSFTADPDEKTKFAVSVADPKVAEEAKGK